jgi:hypothetical protein
MHSGRNEKVYKIRIQKITGEMRKLITALLLVLMLAQIAAAQAAPKITIDRITASGTEAKISWKTNEASTSVITVLDQAKKLENLKEFSTTIQNLEPGKEYQFDITACDASINCANYHGKFTTSQKGNAITGAVISADVINQAKSIAMMVFFSLIAVVVLGVVVRTGYTAIKGMADPAERQMKEAVSNAEGLIRQGKKDEAFAHYNLARTVYSQITPSKQAKYYDRLIATYQTLQEHQKAKEAGKLADRYIAGNITKQELEKLRELLS